MFDEIRANFDAVKKPLDILNTELYKASNKMTAEQKAKFNEFKKYYDVLVNDSSKGIHNDVIYTKAGEKAMAVGSELANSLGIPVPVSE